MCGTKILAALVKGAFNMNAAPMELKENGFHVTKNVWDRKKTETIYKIVVENIEKCAKQLECGLEDYLKNISRWTHPSPVTNNIYAQVESDFKQFSSNSIQKKVRLVELDVIRKSHNANRATPCHQDIAYTPENPYDFSVWLSLQDVSMEDGVLELLPGSHLAKIDPPVDYWQPDFMDKMQLSSLWRDHFRAFPVEAGDCILFDSRIWHRSDANRTGRDRVAIVTRWRVLEDKPSYDVPEKIYSEFGIWTCGERTKTLLKQGLEKIFQLNVVGDLKNCIDLWLDIFSREEKLPMVINTLQAQNALKDLLILHKASALHNGGDMQGIIYPAIWEHFLKPLSKWLKNNGSNQGIRPLV